MADPPIIADIGDAYVLFANTTMSTDVSTILHSGAESEKFEVCLKNMKLDSI